jgi:hypothetical protein
MPRLASCAPPWVQSPLLAAGELVGACELAETRGLAVACALAEACGLVAGRGLAETVGLTGAGGLAEADGAASAANPTAKTAAAVLTAGRRLPVIAASLVSYVAPGAAMATASIG